MSPSSSRCVIAVLLTGSLSFAACVGDVPSSDPGDAGSAGDATFDSGTSLPDSSSGADVATIPDAEQGTDAAQLPDAPHDTDAGMTADAGHDVDAATTADVGADVGPDVSTVVDAGPPTVTCVQENPNGGAFNTRRATKPAMGLGGSIALGSYERTSLYEVGQGGAALGRADVFQQGTNLFLQYVEIPMTGGTAIYGTKWMEANPDGSLKLTEMCRAGKLGTVELGTYEMRSTVDGGVTVKELFLDYGTPKQERYTHQ